MLKLFGLVYLGEMIGEVIRVPAIEHLGLFFGVLVIIVVAVLLTYMMMEGR